MGAGLLQQKEPHRGSAWPRCEPRAHREGTRQSEVCARPARHPTALSFHLPLLEIIMTVTKPPSPEELGAAGTHAGAAAARPRSQPGTARDGALPPCRNGWAEPKGTARARLPPELGRCSGAPGPVAAPRERWRPAPNRGRPRPAALPFRRPLRRARPRCIPGCGHCARQRAGGGTCARG